MPTSWRSTPSTGRCSPTRPNRYVSGGDPVSIPDLTYESFLDHHRRFYAPSNALIFLDGAVDLDAVLKLLDEEYLCGFTRTERTVFPAAAKAGGRRHPGGEV